jgi:hypothetical protein
VANERIDRLGTSAIRDSRPAVEPRWGNARFTAPPPANRVSSCPPTLASRDTLGSKPAAVYQDPDGIRPSPTLPDREVRWRLVGDLVVEVVVDTTDGWIVTVWVKDRR